MATYSKIEVLLKMHQNRVIPVFYNSDLENSKNVLKACYNGGIRLFEFTNRGDGALDIFKELMSYVQSECPEMILGVGSIVDAPTAALFVHYGANFVVGPCFNEEVARFCNRHQILYTPGCGSVTEIGYAQECGCELVKIFPAASVGGPAFVKDVLAPMPWSLIMATGAVEPEKDNLQSWFKAGTYCVGMGSKLFPKDVIAAKNWKYITEKCAEVLSYVK